MRKGDRRVMIAALISVNSLRGFAPIWPHFDLALSVKRGGVGSVLVIPPGVA